MKKRIKKLVLAKETVLIVGGSGPVIEPTTTPTPTGGPTEVYSCGGGCYSVEQTCISLCPC